MTIGRARASVLIAVMLSVLLTTSSAHALFSGDQQKCFGAIGKSGLNFVKGKLKILQKCKDAFLKDGSCTVPDAAAITKLETKLAAGIDKACTIPSGNYAAMGFPGQCSDANLNDGFTQADLKACILASHETIVDQMIALEYDTTITGPLSSSELKCQKEIAKNSGAVVAAILKAVQKCRQDVNNCTIDGDTQLTTCKINGISPEDCATDHVKTAAAVNKAKNKALAAIAAKCPDLDVAAIEACEPDQGTGAAAASCEVNGHSDLTDNPSVAAAPDLIDYEYARAGVCGDNIRNNLNEECDGTDDADCPGLCGTAEVPDGHFACLCKDKPRVAIVEHANADTDNGWNGISSDGAVVEGGSYVIDLNDCDGFGVCNAGPTCSLPPHSSCAVPSNAPQGSTSSAICTGLGQGICRKERTATGPHCYQDINKRCPEKDTVTDTACTGLGDFCQRTFHGAPVAQAAGGVAVCNVSTFSEDIVGTFNINTGESALKVRQRAVVYNPISQDKPCPVCGGWCAVSRDRCDDDLDCPGLTGPCVTAAICSDGLRQNEPCRRTAPFGGEVPPFGVTSVDCLPDTAQITNPNSGLDINPNPRTTGTVTLAPSFPCTGAGFTGNTCLGGTSEGRPCTTASECPGGACSPQCFCSGQLVPNACQPACVGGGNDALACIDDSECPGGFCHPGDCRLDPSDTDSNQEGLCSSGPNDGHCSITSYRGCDDDTECAPPLCPLCQPAETCLFSNRACFVNTGIIRTGAPGLPDRDTAGLYCVPSNNGAINSSAGFAGPGALIQHETIIITP